MSATKIRVGELADCVYKTSAKGREEARFERPEPKAQKLLDVLNENPFRKPPPFEKLVGDLSEAYLRRINIQHRLVYQVLEEDRVVKVLRL